VRKAVRKNLLDDPAVRAIVQTNYRDRDGTQRGGLIVCRPQCGNGGRSSSEVTPLDR